MQPNQTPLFTKWCRAVYSLIHLCVFSVSFKPLLHATNQVFNSHSRYTSRYDFCVRTYQPTCRYPSEHITGYFVSFGLVCFSYFTYHHPLTLPAGVLVLFMQLLCNNTCSVTSIVLFSK